MFRNIIFFLMIFLLTIALLFSCSKKTVEASINNSELFSAEKKSLVNSSNKFGFQLLKTIAATEKTDNIVISPVSVSMALAMTLNGAEGATKSEMLATLECSGKSVESLNSGYEKLLKSWTALDKNVQLQIANSIWYDSKFDVAKNFIKVNKDYFGARISGLAFKNPTAARTINSWVAENTRHKISQIVDTINPLDVMFLINAIYFKGAWEKPFDKKATTKQDFTLLDGSKKKYDMMVQTGDYFFMKNERLQMIKLDYGDGLFSMILLLPEPSVKIDELVAGMNETKMSQWIGQMKKVHGSITLPRFKIEYDKSLKNTLQQMGMRTSFTKRANFTGINSLGKIKISEVKHKTFIEVNEEGTEAAAATSVRMMFMSARPVFRMFVNRPFVFAIQENGSGALLFLGKIVKPK